MIIAIDGPAGAGKSTTAKAVAAPFGWLYVDTGAMYRAVALMAHEAGLEPSRDGEAIAKLARRAEIVLNRDGVTVGGRDVSRDVRRPEIAQLASQVAALPDVREAMVELQRKIAREGEAQTGGAVLEGRDIQTVVFPDAEVKVFLTADLHTRAARRDAEMPSRPGETSHAALAERDARDQKREVAPLVAHPDAVHLATDSLSIEAVAARIEDLIRARMTPGLSP